MIQKVNYRIDVGDCEDIDLQLPYDILKKIKSIVRYKRDSIGEKKYGSRKHFIITACNKLIQEENKK